MSLTTWPRAVSGEAAAPVTTVTSTRRTDLDWIRVAAFGLLILYHVALVYAPFDWHVHSRHTAGWLREGLLVTQPWRLTLLFLVSGAAVRFLAGSRPVGEVLGDRVARLGPPLLFGVLVLVPIQSWIEAMDKGSWNAGLIPWVMQEFSPAGIADGVPVNHLWFVVYIAVYSAIVTPLIAWPQVTARLETLLDRHLGGWRLLVIPAAYLIVARMFLYWRFGQTNMLWGDWYNHAQSLAAFLFGFLAARRAGVWDSFERLRWPALGMAVVALATAMVQSGHPGGGAYWEIPRNGVYALDQWLWIVAILGFASRHLRGRQSTALTYLNAAVFPCYLAHQTILVIAAWLIKPTGLPAAVEALSLAVVTIGGSLLIYEGVRRVGPLRQVWGLKPERR